MTCKIIGYKKITIMFFLIFLSTTPAIFSQTKVLYKCPHNDFAVRVADTSYANWLYKDHNLFIHNQKTSTASFKNEYTDDYQKNISEELKKFICPEGDMELYSSDIKELKFIAGTHFKLTHNKDYTDQELEGMIK